MPLVHLIWQVAANLPFELPLTFIPFCTLLSSYMVMSFFYAHLHVLVDGLPICDFLVLLALISRVVVHLPSC